MNADRTDHPPGVSRRDGYFGRSSEIIAKIYFCNQIVTIFAVGWCMVMVN